MRGGTDESPGDERIKARIKGIIKQADTENTDLFASLLLQTYRMEEGRGKKILIAAIVLTFVLTMAAYTICLLIYRYFHDVPL
jgi:hypothetical protein